MVKITRIERKDEYIKVYTDLGDNYAWTFNLADIKDNADLKAKMEWALKSHNSLTAKKTENSTKFNNIKTLEDTDIEDA
ncbi:unnamed protein product [marine sediment metagenome]|uniref:Uncharacterized protein n=1 Tax=marine sediment metagenome TaxID=412755 RepID=X1BKQ9_9ZZZZ